MDLPSRGYKLTSRQAHAGIYHNLPFGLAVENNIKLLIEFYMKRVGKKFVDPRFQPFNIV